MCSIAESMLGSCPSPGANIPVMTFSPESAAKVRGRRNSWAARVITTCTRIPRSCSRRTISAALYAAIPPVTPRAIFMDSGLLIHGVEPRLPQSTISDHEIKNSVSPGQAPYPAPLPLARRRSGFPESPTSPCPHGFHPAQCGMACESLCRPLAVPPTAVAALVVLPPGCIGSCCQSLRSTSLGLSLTSSSIECMPNVEQCVPQNTTNFQACPALSTHGFRRPFSGVLEIIPRNLKPCRRHGIAEGSKDRSHPVPDIRQTVTVPLFYNFFLFCGKRLPGAPQAFRPHDRPQAVDRFFKIVIDQNVVVLVIVLNFSAGRQQSTRNHLFRVLAAFAQARFQGLAVRRQHEDADRIRQLLLDLLGALHINIEKKVVSFLSGVLQKLPRGAVVIPVKVGVLQEFAGSNHSLKFVAWNEMVLLAVLLAAPQSARGVRNREIEIRNQLQQLVDQGRLPRARRRRDDVDEGPVGCVHSRFCTCSRDFSISAFMAKPASVIFSASPASPDVFESKVLASRFISCSRKSSFFPISPPASSSPRKCCTCVSRRTISS